MVFDRKTFINETTRPKQEVKMTQAKTDDCATDNDLQNV